ncbi:peptidoglycan D,D-transpeptidase FtsI family protein [Bacillus testis]|uniref:peptidoglycan D,D-transpeptidase FtsI family protein n=1 Tax=Bacillus testis TaxID=1622072 RepID=UPI00067F2180|nr:penicillin-binding protein 2 [Bacillus testis]
MKSKKKKTHVPFRLNMLFFVIFLLFSALILRLGVVQIVYGDDYRREIERTEDVTVNNPVPRGKIFDRNQKVVVDNTPVDAITYTRVQGTTTEEMLKTAEDLAKVIHMDTKKITERDKKDFWILKNPEKAQKLISEKELEKLTEEKKDNSEIYKIQIDRITEKDLESFTEGDLQVLAIYREMASAKALTPQIIKNKDVTPQEVAIVSENLESLQGVDVTTDWDRKYLFDKTLKSVIGKVSSSSEGLPLEKLAYFKARDYNNNDRVGKSYLEMQYEDVLHGQKAKVKNVTDKSGNVLQSEVITEGQRGKDLITTIDMDLQLATEKIIEEELRSKKAMGGTYLLDRAFVVMMNPNTGEILTMAGKQYDRDKNGKAVFNDFSLGTFTTSYEMGSVVKGATVLTGYQTGALRPNQYIFDSPLYIKGTPKKGSWKNMGLINDLTALKQSSNVYMFKTAIAIGGGQYVQNRSLNLNLEAFDKIRYFFNQFGLGVRTGIDLPNEMAGYQGTKMSGKLLDLAIGQYDTYTPLQLAQYVSTIANGGKRIQPHIVKEIREPSNDPKQLGPLIQSVSPKVLNTVDMKKEWIERVQTGFKQVMQSPGGTGYSKFGNASYNMAGKTGTAQVAVYTGPKKDQYPNVSTMNVTMIGYAPADNPEVAISVVVPWAYQGNTGHSMNMDIAKKVMDKYFELKKERSSDKEQTDKEEA